MSASPKPKSVWISPAVIGQQPRALRLTNSLGNYDVAEEQLLSPELPTMHSTESSENPPTSKEEIADVLTRAGPPSEESGTSKVQLMATMVPLPESDSDEPDGIGSPNITTQEVLVLLDTESQGGLGTPSKEWHSPTYSDEGIAARVWVSPQIAEYERWMTVKANLKTVELIPRSPYVPRTFSDWLIHRAEMTDIKIRELGKQLEHKEAMALLGPDRPKVLPTFGGRTFEDADNGVSRSGVGAEETVWSLWMKPTKTRPRADWPCQAEMREEGDERNTSGFGRFPALPRVNGNETVNYKHKRIVTATPLDTVWPPPVPLAYQEQTEELDDDYARVLIGKDLAAAIDEV